MIKRIFYTLFPKLLFKLNIFVSYIYEAYRFSKYCTNNDYQSNKDKHRAVMIRKCHGVEKAFSLPNMKEKFGVVQASALLNEVNLYKDKYGIDSYIIEAISILRNYFEYHKQVEDESIASIKEQFLTLLSQQESKSKLVKCYLPVSNTSRITSEEFQVFFKTRHSVRAYDDFVVPRTIIDDILATAEKTPSACNRQPWKVRILQNDKDIQHSLSFQNGNRGFGGSIKNLMIITGKISCFSSKERNQVFIDAGMYSLSIMLACHSHKLSSCPLNLSFPINEELKLARALDFDKDEVPIMMIAFGKAVEDSVVAKSFRRPQAEYSLFQ